ncbi:MAG: SIS domain-containing protein, partial [Chloroflexota bacterium]|nr:SIS domain-containing protein [Chloroflexota bacterium]
ELDWEAPVEHAYREIHNQANAWQQTLPAVREQWQQISRWIEVPADAHFLFIGAGTSYYLARCAAQTFQEVTGRISTALPASETYLSPQSNVPRNVPLIAFVISRSGTTSEALSAANYLQTNVPGVELIGVTCNTSTQLSGYVQHIVELPFAPEESVVMTQSFTTMLLALQAVAALVAGDDRLLDELARLPDLLREHMWEFQWFGRSLGQNLNLKHFVYLGLGPYSGLAQEATLKLKEMTQTPCEAYSPLEFRHGPISILQGGVAVVLLEGERARHHMPLLEDDIREHGAYVAVLAPYEPEAQVDQALKLPEDLSDLARCVLYMPALQLLAYYRALALGLDPDQPRHLTQVVVI